jgi:hypothetical protein
MGLMLANVGQLVNNASFFTFSIELELKIIVHAYVPCPLFIMATEEPKKKFDAHAKHFFLTYSQSTPLDHQYLHTKLLNIHPNVYNVYSCR